MSRVETLVTIRSKTYKRIDFYDCETNYVCCGYFYLLSQQHQLLLGIGKTFSDENKLIIKEIDDAINVLRGVQPSANYFMEVQA